LWARCLGICAYCGAELLGNWTIYLTLVAQLDQLIIYEKAAQPDMQRLNQGLQQMGQGFQTQI